VFGRFLARVFSSPTSPWVLKGGNAVLVRVQDARSTTDIDLFHQLDDLDVAIAAVRRAADLDLGDHFRFVITRVDTEVGGTAQPNVAGAQLHLDTYIGTRKINGFHVDLATGSLMTAEPQTRPAISITCPGSPRRSCGCTRSWTTSPTSSARSKPSTDKTNAPPAATATSSTWSCSP
jgi:hypothetical protein